MADDPNEFVAKCKMKRHLFWCKYDYAVVDFVESGGKPPPIATPQPPAPTGATKKGQAALTGEESNGSQVTPLPHSFLANPRRRHYLAQQTKHQLRHSTQLKVVIH
eukprot:GHVN01083063.1.p1 GENE.GHVN01083063.1~~GHVN01083063.1.p1  ORF type:complete len:106 (-),score=12.40 GHVN01083063.1:283-600(-)